MIIYFYWQGILFSKEEGNGYAQVLSLNLVFCAIIESWPFFYGKITF